MSNPFPTTIHRENADLMKDLGRRLRALGYVSDADFVDAIAGNFMDARYHHENDIYTPPITLPGQVYELPEWGTVQGDSEAQNRRVPLANGTVYSMRVPAKGRTVVGSLAIVPAGSGGIGGKLSLVRGDIDGWDGSNASAGGAFMERYEGAPGDLWFSFRLGKDQPGTDVNVLIQYQ